MALGDLVIRMAADVATLQSDLGRAAHLADRFANRVNRVLGGLTIGLSGAAFVSFIKGSIDAADSLNDLRTRTGLTGQELLVLQGAAVRSGVELEAVSDVTSKMSKRLGAAALQTGEAAAAYQAMGISVTKAGGGLKNVGEILRELGAKFKTYEDGANKSVLATAALGRGGDKLIPVIEAIGETEERFKRLGVTIDEDFIGAADRFKDTLRDLESVNQVLSRQIASELLPYLQQFIEAMIEASKQTAGLKVAADLVIVPLKLLATGFLTIGAAIAAAGEDVAGLVAAAAALATGRGLGAALDELNIGGQKAQTTFENASKVIAKFWENAEPPKDFRDKWDRATQGINKGQAPGIPDKAAGDALTALLDAQLKNQLELLKNSSQREDALLEAKHSNNLVSEREYWQRKIGIQKESLDAELKALDEQIKRQIELRDKTPSGSADFYKAQKNLEDSLAKRNELELKFAGIVETTGIAATKAAKDYRNAIEDLNVQLLELEGKSAEAAGRRFKLSTENLREKLTVNEDAEGLKALDRLEKLSAAQAEFNQLKEEQGRITARLAIEEERINNSVRAGSMSQLDAERNLGDARRSAADELGAISEKMDEIAAKAENPALVLQAEQAKAGVESLRTQIDLTAQHITKTFVDGWADAFTDFVMGTKSAKDAFRDFAKSVISDLVRMAAQRQATNFFGDIGGIILSAAGAFGGGGSATPLADQAAASGIIGPYASGTDYVPRTGLALIHQGEAVIPAEENTRGRGAPIYQTTINATDAQSFAALMASAQGQRIILSTVVRAHNRRGRNAGF